MAGRIYFEDPPARIIATLFRILIERWLWPNRPLRPDIADWEAQIAQHIEFIVLTARREQAIEDHAPAIVVERLSQDIFQSKYAINSTELGRLMREFKVSADPKLPQ